MARIETESWPATYDGAARERVGFFTDTTVCIGCKACEVACKQWNQLPEDGFVFTGKSYDNTGALGAETWRHVAFIEQIVPLVETAGGRATTTATRCAWLMSSDVCKHCTRGGVPRRVPDRRPHPHRVRHRVRAGRHLQRLRLLRPRLPVRRHRPPRARRRRPGMEVHALLRPHQGRPRPRPAPGLPHRVDPVRAARRAARAGRRTASERAAAGLRRRPAVRRGPGRRRRRLRRLLPAAGRARGLRPAARPGRPHQRLGEMWGAAAAAGAALALGVAASLLGRRG